MTVLFKRTLEGVAGRPHVFVGHSQPTHSGYMLPLCEKLNGLGFTVHTGDLRGHGQSVSRNTPRAHLDPKTGWEDLKGDMRFFLEEAFRNVPWEDRIVIAPNISAMLTIDLLKETPDLARRIVFMSPPPYSKGLAFFTKAFTQARLLFAPSNVPDQHAFHHVQSFLDERFSAHAASEFVLSRDQDFVEKCRSDTDAWPVPTLGYWSSIAKGYTRMVADARSPDLAHGTRVLTTYGEFDSLLGDWSKVLQFNESFKTLGAHSADALMIKDGYTHYYLDFDVARTFDAILPFLLDQHGADIDTEISRADEDTDFLSTLLDGGRNADNSEADLLELCYSGVHNDRHWVQMIGQFASEAELDGDESEAAVLHKIMQLMPHWQRAFELNQKLLDSAAMGVILQNVVERLAIGTAVVNENLEIVTANSVFHEIVERLHGSRGKQAGLFLKEGFRQSDNGLEGVIVHGDCAVGYVFKPKSLLQASLKRGGPVAVVVMRDPALDCRDTDASRVELLELAYGLTAQEAAVALKLSAGQSPEEIADSLGVSINTIRTHLKRCYEKLGVQGQNALSVKILRGPVGWLTGKVAARQDELVTHTDDAPVVAAP